MQTADSARVATERPSRCRSRALRGAVALLAIAGLVGCGTTTPRIRPEKNSRRVSKQQMQRDVNQCVAQAEEFRRRANAESNGRAVEEVTVRAAEGAAGGAVFGDAGRGAAAGAAVGAAGSIVRGFFRSKRLDPEVENRAARCLEERGYRVER